MRNEHVHAVSFNRSAQHVEHGRGTLAVRIHALVHDLGEQAHFFKTRNRVVRIEFVEKFFHETRLIVVDYVHIEVGKIALAVARRKQFFAHAVVAFHNCHFKCRRQLRRKKQSSCPSAYNDNVVIFGIHSHILPHPIA